jgi:hypothetical protein
MVYYYWKRVIRFFLGVVAHTCNPSYSGDLYRVDCSSRSAWAKSSQDPISINKKAGYSGLFLNLRHMGSINRRIAIQTSPGIKEDPISNITKTKRPGSMAQVVEQLSSKFKNSNPGNTKNK